MLRAHQRLLLVLPFLLTSCFGEEPPVEERMVGTWHTVMINQAGTWTLRFQVEADGRYRTSFTGPFPLPDETGAVTVRDGRWSADKDNGQSDDGEYSFLQPDTVVFEGEGGKLTRPRPPPSRSARRRAAT